MLVSTQRSGSGVEIACKPCMLHDMKAPFWSAAAMQTGLLDVMAIADASAGLLQVSIAPNFVVDGTDHRSQDIWHEAAALARVSAVLQLHDRQGSRNPLQGP